MGRDACSAGAPDCWPIGAASPTVERSRGGRSLAMFMSGFRLVEKLALIAAVGAGRLGLSYFFLDGLPKPWFVPGIAFGGSIDMGLFLTAASVILVVSQFVRRAPAALA